MANRGMGSYLFPALSSGWCSTVIDLLGGKIVKGFEAARISSFR